MSGPADIDALRRLTPARLRLAAGAEVSPLGAVLDFQASHAEARDAIRQPVDWAQVTEPLGQTATIRVHSRADDRTIYLRRPDLGRRLRDADAALLPDGPFDIALIVADGLSARAINETAGDLAAALIARLGDLAIAPVVLAGQGRVGIGDDIGARMRAGLVIVLIGERPGLSVTNSVGAYITLAPRVGTPDSARNCVSNIHGNGGLSVVQAADRITWLVRQARRLGQTGVALKDMSDDGAAIE